MPEHLYKNWYVQDPNRYSTVVYNHTTCYKLTTTIGLNVAENYFYTNFLYPNEIGNSVTVKSNNGTSVASLAISDGLYSVVANIGNNNITIGSNTFSFTTNSFTNYTLNLIGNEYKFFIEDEVVLSGTASPSTDLPIIYYGFYSNPVFNDTVYVPYIKSGRSIEEQYRVGNWYLNDIRGYSVVTYEGVTCTELNSIVGPSSALNSFFYTRDVSDDATGNTISARIAFNPETIMLADSNNYMYASEDDVFFTASNNSVAQLLLADGPYMVVANIGNGQVVVGENEYTLSTTQFHDYWLTLKNGKYQLFVDGILLLEGDAIPSNSRMAAFGFLGSPAIGDSVYIKYLKHTKEYKRPLDLSKMSFELQVDTSDTFDSINLKSYYDIDNIVYENNNEVGTALGDGIVRSFTIPILPRQDMRNICYFFRVRANSDYYTSDWAYYYFDEPAIDILFTKKDTMKQIKYKVDKMVAFCYEGRQSYMLIENPGPSDFREGYVQIKDSEAIWKPISSSYFLLDPNMSSYYFDSIYNYRMPDEEVYTKYDKSGNIANAIDSETVLLDMVAFEIKNSSRDLDVHLCRDSYLYNNFGKQYSLASEYFNTINEFRNTLLMVINDYCEPGNTYKLQEILATITGVIPRIEEFKHKKKWVIWDSATSLIKPDNEKYILFNPNLPYSNKNKAVLQTAEGKAFTFNIHLYNPLGLNINPDLINVIVSSFKPVFSQANIIFYTQDGMPYTYPAEYYFSSFGQGLYYREDTQENN